MVVIPEEAPEDEEPENLIEISTASTMEPQVGTWGWKPWDGRTQAPAARLSSAPSVFSRSPRIYLTKPLGLPTAFGMTGMGGPVVMPVGWPLPHETNLLFPCRDAQIESLKKEVDVLRAEMEKIKLEVKPCWEAASAGERGAFGCCSIETPMGCSRRRVLAPSAVLQASPSARTQLLMGWDGGI